MDMNLKNLQITMDISGMGVEKKYGVYLLKLYLKMK